LLWKLLRLLVSGRGWTLTELAQELDVDPRLIPQMLTDLSRAGYVQEVPMDCSGLCKQCAKQGACGLHFDGRMWSVTPKALRASWPKD
jgi:Mn-dependent DtxR family transcriptional regulator